jgi:hypothetical protein
MSHPGFRPNTLFMPHASTRRQNDSSCSSVAAMGAFATRAGLAHLCSQFAMLSSACALVMAARPTAGQRPACQGDMRPPGVCRTQRPSPGVTGSSPAIEE